MEYKSNHFVPKCYQKKWFNNKNLNLQYKKDKIVFLIKQTGKILYDIPKNIAQKNNLYTIPDEFKTADNKINEKLLVKRFEDWFVEAMKNSIDFNKIPTSSDAYKIASFVIVQSFRTLKFKKSNEAKIAKNINFKNSPKWHQDFSLQLSFLILKGFPELIKNAKIVFYKSPANVRFITSDNPATYWLVNGQSYNYVESIATNFVIKDNPNLRIICPLNPNWCAEISLFQKSVKRKSILKIEKTIKNLSINKFEEIQSMIYRSADKIIIASDELDLTKIHNKNSLETTKIK